MGGSVTTKEAGLEDLVKRAATLKNQRTRIRAAIKQLAGDAVTLGWKFWSETMLAGLTSDLHDCYHDIIREELPDHCFFKDAPRPQASVRLKDEWDGRRCTAKAQR